MTMELMAQIHSRHLQASQVLATSLPPSSSNAAREPGLTVLEASTDFGRQLSSISSSSGTCSIGRNRAGMGGQSAP